MSIFRTETIKCPACRQAIEYGVVYSVNADRRPDLREAILDNSFQRVSCLKCGETFRLEPRVTYLDEEHHQWILVESATGLAKWVDMEKKAHAAFDQTYGPKAPAAARLIGTSLKTRVTFGWAALREKVLAARHGIDDATLELAKLAILRGGGGSVPLADDVELRLNDVVDGFLVMTWIKPTTGEVLDAMRVERALLDDVESQAADWQPLRDELSAGPFVDVHRLLVAGKP